MSSTSWTLWPLRAVLIALALSGAAGCAVQSQMTNGWHDTTLASGSLHNVLVIAIRKDPVRRRAWEDAFSKALDGRGVSATSSYRLYADASPDTDDVIAAIRAHDYDAVLVCTRLPDEATSHYVPGESRAEPVTSQDYYGRFHSHWINVQSAGYTETDTVVQVQTEVYTTRKDGGRLVWSGTLRTLESTLDGTVDEAVSRRIMPELERQGVFPGRNHRS